MSFIPIAVPYLVEQHAQEAAFLWTSRDRATNSPAYDLDDLCQLDRRVEAQVDGLRIAGDVGWELALEELELEMDPGAAFVAARLALELGNTKGFAAVLDLVEGEPAAWRAVPSAIGFCAFETVEKVLAALVADSVPAAMRRMGIAGYAAHRRHPGPALGWALSDGDQALRLRGLKAVGELGDLALLDVVRAALTDDDHEVRFWAARSAMLLGDAAATDPLIKLAEAGDPISEEAARLAATALDAGAANAWIRDLDARGHRRAALRAAAASGATALVPWLTSLVEDTEHARLVGHALYAITGTPIDDALEADGPDGDDDEEDFEGDGDEDLELAFDDDLPWPDPEAVNAAFAAVEPSSDKVLLGKPCTPEWIADVLRLGMQPQREVAAWLSCRTAPGTALADVRAPGFRQLG